MHKYLVELLCCPVCHGSLDWKIKRENEKRIIEAEATCSKCGEKYIIMDGIGIFLTSEYNRNDLWEMSNSHFTELFKNNPEIEMKLMEYSIEELSPADLFFRGMVLEERHQLEEAKQIFKLATKRLYTEEYLNCANKQIDFTCDSLKENNEPVLDLACGRGYLVEKMARRLHCPIIATDFSPRILRRNKEIWEKEGLYENISLIAFDARKMPFQDKSIKFMTSNLGLPNIGNSESLIPELKRVISGKLLSILYFYPETDSTNIEVLKKYNILEFSLKKKTVSLFAEAGLKTTIKNACNSVAKPTPVAEIIQGGGIDALPVEDTVLQWCVLEVEGS